MDVLQYWKPTIDWRGFQQGPLSDEAWQHLRNIVCLAHVANHWEGVARNQRMTPLPKSFFEESKYKNKKRRDERIVEIKRSEGHRNRATFLLDDEISRLSYLTGNPHDIKLFMCFRGSMGNPSSDRDRDRSKIALFTEFDASVELADEPVIIIDRWCKRAGFVV